MRGDVAVQCEGLVRTYRTGTSEVRALQGVTIDLLRGALNVVAGPSGCGKSTLLRLLGAMDLPTEGRIEAGRLVISSLGARGRRRFRRDKAWFVFQQPSDNFYPHLTLEEQFPRAQPGAIRTLDPLGMAHRLRHRPEAMSGGEQQRAAFAQAVGAGAELVLADEPTAELDSESAAALISVMKTLADQGVTVVVATHDNAVLAAADHVVELDHGRVSQDHLSVGASRRLPTGSSRGFAWKDLGRSRGAPQRPPSFHADIESPVGLGVPPPRIAEGEPRDLVLAAQGLRKRYGRGGDAVRAVEDVSVSFRAAELVGIMGRSGSGKTTLLNLLGGWEQPDHGTVSWAGFEGQDDGQGTASPPWQVVAFVPQHLGLMNELTVRENVELPRYLAGEPIGDGSHVEELLERLGITQVAARFPSETSLGEQQRAALARGLAILPSLLLADEPTGHQDRKSARSIFETLAWASTMGTCCVVATHDPSILPFLDRTLSMVDGRLTNEQD